MKLKYNDKQRKEYFRTTLRMGAAWLSVFEEDEEFYSSAYWDLLTNIWVKDAPVRKTDALRFMTNIKSPHTAGKYVETAIEKGFREQAESGYLVGFPIIDFTVTLYDGAYHDVDSSAIAFEIAGRGAMREVAQKAGIKLLEPIMKVEVVTPEDYLGDVIGDINSRRGQIQGTDSRGNAQAVEAMVPLANMFGYVNELRSFTQGRAQYSMQFSHYDEVPANVAAEVKEKLA